MIHRKEQAVSKLISGYFKGTLKHFGVRADCGCAIVHIEGRYVLAYDNEHAYQDTSSGYSGPEFRQVEQAFEFFGKGLRTGATKRRKDKDAFIGLTAVFVMLDLLDPEPATIDLHNLDYSVV